MRVAFTSCEPIVQSPTSFLFLRYPRTYQFLVTRVGIKMTVESVDFFLCQFSPHIDLMPHFTHTYTFRYRYVCVISIEDLEYFTRMYLSDVDLTAIRLGLQVSPIYPT